MKFIKNALEEIYSLFIDDPVFVGLLRGWMTVVYVARKSMPPSIAGPSLFGGFAILLVAFCFRKAKATARVQRPTPPAKSKTL